MIADNMIAYAEVDEILNLLEDTYRDRVPEKVRNFFKEERNSEYKIEIDLDKSLTEQNLKRETLVLLAILNLNYWCESEEEKQEFLNQLAENEKARKELEEKYNPDNLFNNRINDDNLVKENLQIIEYKKQNFIQILLNKIMRFFKRRN